MSYSSFAWCVAVLGILSATPELNAAPRQSPDASVAEHAAFLDTYCVACHSGGLANQTSLVPVEQWMDQVDTDLTNIRTEAAIWEKVVKKVNGRMMPPPGMPSADEATTGSFVAFLESELDRPAEASQIPAHTAIHRLNRFEYGNAVRDLLGLKIDPTSLLPPDGSAYGFDNIADILGTSPTLMDRYINAAWKISSWAIGDTTLTPSVQVYPVPLDTSQNDHIEGLPFGTRGGILVDHNFPVDGEYVIKPKLYRSAGNIIRGLELPHELEILIDGERAALNRFGGYEDEYFVYDTPKAHGDELMRRMELRVRVEAGPHRLGATFLKKASSTTHDLFEPFLREKADPRTSVGIPELAFLEVEGPFDVSGPGNSPSRATIFTCYPSIEGETLGCATNILTTLARRAYRRPLSNTEGERLLSIYGRERDLGNSFDGGIHAAIAYMLVTPQFLYRIEEDPDGARPGTEYRIGDLELASRLAFFIWSSVPDDQLLDLAIEGRLKDPEVIGQQVRRMLEDERAGALGSNFAAQWLYLRNLPNKSPDPYIFPDFDHNLRTSLQRETELLFESIAREDRSILELLTANYTFVNERLARHYGIPGIYGDQFRRIEVEEEYRKGLLGHASILAINSYGNRTSPVTRGKYVLTNLLGTPPPDPPPNVPPLDEGQTGLLTMRDRMEAHRVNPACSGCHQYMDPIGLALENYDGVGRWRSEEAGVSIDATGVIPVFRDYGPIAGPVDLREAMLSRPDQFVRTATEMLMTYALGRALTYQDMPVVRSIVRNAAQEDYRFSSLVLGIVQSDPFQMRITRPTENQDQASAEIGANPFTSDSARND